MKVTLSVIKADIGSIGGHICPSRHVLESVRHYIAEHGTSLLIDHYVSSTGDDIAILMSHRHGANQVRDTVSDKAIGMRRQGFFGDAMLPMAELEYTGIMENLKALEPRFHLRAGS